jgi:hypothetical protein
MDANQDILPAASVKLNPDGPTVKTNGQGEFTIPGVAPGSYTITVSYVGFSPQTVDVKVAAGQVAKTNVVLQVASQDQQIMSPEDARTGKRRRLTR